MNRLSKHTNPIPNFVPDLAFVDRFVDRGDRGEHRFLRDGKRPDRRHNAAGHAFIKLHARPTVETHYVRSGEYCVARLYLDQLAGPFPPRSSFINKCGLPQCVNPDHWARVMKAPKWRFELLDYIGWQLVRTATGRPADKDVVVRAKGPNGVVHIFATTPANRRPAAGLPTALCGRTGFPPDLVVVDDLVTCTGGC